VGDDARWGAPLHMCALHGQAQGADAHETGEHRWPLTLLSLAAKPSCATD